MEHVLDPQPKPGYRTTEFWCAVASAVASILQYFPRWAGAGAILAYIACRGAVKATAGK